MGDLTKNISRHELICKCGKCGDMGIMDYQTVSAIQNACLEFSVRYNGRTMIKITSGNRCPEHNELEGGSTNSMHLYKCAVDHRIYVQAYGQPKWRVIPTDELAEFYDKRFPNSCGIGKYPAGRVHFDSRPKRARWDVR